jgi:hypothetical protein
MKIDKTANTNDLITVAGQLTYGGTLQISLLNGSTLSNWDSFRLFSASNYVGTFAAIIPASPGAGLAWNPLTLYTNGILAAIALTPPTLTSISLSGTNLVINGNNAVSGLTCYVLMSTNLALPRSQWTPMATNVLSLNGSFSLTVTNTVNPSVPKQFYLLEMQ